MNTPPNRRILLMDDLPSIHEDFRKILQQDSPAKSELDAFKAALFDDETPTASISFELDSAYQGQEGLAKVEAALQAGRPYAMAFVDMRMPPGWDGVETIQRLWQADPQLQIVICTAYSDCSWEEVLGKLDVRDRLLILKKPFDNIEVYQLASALTAKWEMTQKAALKMSSLESAVQERTHEIRMTNEALQAEIIERKLLESQLVQAQKLESIGQLAAGVAHEINTPIQYIGDNVHFLQKGFLTLYDMRVKFLQLLALSREEALTPEIAAQAERDARKASIEYLLEEIPKAIQEAQEGIQCVSRIVQAMKQFAHPGTEEMTPTDINRAIESVITVARNEWKYLADVVTDFDAELPLVPCLPGDFNQVVLNLLVNAAHAIADAVEASGDKGVITLSTRNLGDQVEIRIQDTGTGISDAARSRIFDPFFTTKEVGKGTGQGLSIAHSIIVNKHRGQILFETEMGKGTTFILRLPLHTEGDVAQ
ncbi:MAG TPA: ATP-binding protein [Chthonomonadaceae bacterium]|nr:ATP-binding protein [Chthonomonadaceae bacterium]